MAGLSRGMQYARYTSNYLCIKCTFLNFSRNTNCYTDGKFIYTSFGQMVDFLVEHTSNGQWPADKAREFYEKELPGLNYWKKKGSTSA